MLTIMLTLASLLISPSLLSTTNYCGINTAQHFIRAKIVKLGQAQLDTPAPAQVEITTREFDAARVLVREQRHTRSIGFNFQYTTVNLESIDAMTNGHLHSWDFPFEGRLHKSDSELFYNIVPALSVSSNALKDPQLIGSDSLQLYTGLVYKKNISIENAWLLGFRSDHRFGSYKVYPVVGFCMQPASDWELQLALPDFSITKGFKGGFSLKLFAEPTGNQWHVFSKDTKRESNFTYEAITTGLTALWRISDSMNVSLGIENQTNRRLSFVLDDNTFIEPKAESARGMMVRGEVLF
jgi:hypothetical protein